MRGVGRLLGLAREDRVGVEAGAVVLDRDLAVAPADTKLDLDPRGDLVAAAVLERVREELARRVLRARDGLVLVAEGLHGRGQVLDDVHRRLPVLRRQRERARVDVGPPLVRAPARVELV